MKMRNQTGLRVALAIWLASLAVLAGCGPNQSTGPTGHGTKRKLGKRYFKITSAGRKIGYGFMDFRIEDGKAVNELNTYRPTGQEPPNNEWTHVVKVRHVETFDGKPLVCDAEYVGQGRQTFTAHPDGRMTVRTTNYSTTRPDEAETKELTTKWPPAAILWHAQRLLAERMGLKEGTTYSYRQFSEGRIALVTAQVGARKKVTVGQQEMELTEVAITTKERQSPSGPEISSTETMYLDDNFDMHRLDRGSGSEQTISVSCSQAEAVKPPETAPTSAD